MRLRFRERFSAILLHLGIRGLLRFVPLSPDCASIRVTEKCNSRCITCNAWKNKSEDELTTEEIKDVLRQLKDIGVTQVIFVGGEPLLRRDIGDLIREASLLKFETRMVVTNGLLLEDKAEELLENGLTHLSVSVDGIGHTNEVIRGVPSNYEKCIRGIEAVQKLKKDKGLETSVTLITTILLNQNVDEIPQLIRVSRSLGVHWDYNLLDPNLDIFRGILFSELLVKDATEIDRTIDYLKKTRRESPWLISSCDHMLEYARNYLKGNKQNGFHCVHGYKLVYLRSHGEVHPGCWIMEPLGNIRESKLRDIWGSKKHRELAKRMYMNECPGCTNLYAYNVTIQHLLSHRFYCKK